MGGEEALQVGMLPLGVTTGCSMAFDTAWLLHVSAALPASGKAAMLRWSPEMRLWPHGKTGGKSVMRPLNRGTRFQRCRGAGRCDCWAAVPGSCQTRGATLCCECAQAAEAPRAGSISVTSSLHFSPGYKPCRSFRLVLECRVYSVYVHPLQILRLRTIFFCPSCLPQAPWIW